MSRLVSRVIVATLWLIDNSWIVSLSFFLEKLIAKISYLSPKLLLELALEDL